MKGTQAMTAEQEAQAQDLALRITEAIADDVLRIARLLVSKDTRHTFGQTELQLRDLIHQAGAKALQTARAQKKTATTDAPYSARTARTPPSSKAIDPRPSRVCSDPSASSVATTTVVAAATAASPSTTTPAWDRTALPPAPNDSSVCWE